MAEHTPWEWLFYASLLILLLWLVLKLTGLINTPLVVELGVPIATGAAAFFTLYRDLADRIGSVKTDIIDRVGAVKNEVGSLRSEVGMVKIKVEHIEKDVDELKKKRR